MKINKYDVTDKSVRYCLFAALAIIIAIAVFGCSKKEEPVPVPHQQAYEQQVQQQPQIIQQAPAPIIIQNAPAPAPVQSSGDSHAMTTLLAAGAGAYVGSKMAQPEPQRRSYYEERPRQSYYEPRRAPTIVRETRVVNNYIREPKSSPKPSTSFRVDPPRPKVDLSKPKKSSTSCRPPYCTR